MRALCLTVSLSLSLAACNSGPTGGSGLDMSSAGGADLSLAPDGRGGGGDDGGAADLRYPEDGCDTEHSCRQGLCYAPGEPRGCGICRNPDPSELCAMDADCQKNGATGICLSSVSNCTCRGEAICRPGCLSAADCGEAQVCSPGHRCVGKSCGGDGDCPADMRCSAGKQCERRSCTGSDSCAGFCVKGQCYGTPGTCMLPAA